jgi:hypothetical protein
VVSLDDYRKKGQPAIPTIEIQLLPSGLIGLNTANLHDGHAFQALLGCYAVAGELLETLREKMKCGAGEGCGAPE